MNHRSSPSPRGLLARLAAAVLSCASLGAAQEVFVVPGTHSSIQDAVNAASGPTEVFVLGGVHNAFTISDKSDLTVIGQAQPIISGAPGDAIAITGGADVTVSGFLISQPGDAAVSVSGTTRATIERCEAVQTSGSGIEVDDAPAVVISRCTLTASGDDAILLTGTDTSGRVERNDILGTSGVGDGIRVDDARGVTIERNRVEGTAQHGIFLGTAIHCRVERNVVKAPVATGVRVDGDNHYVVRTTVSDPGNRGIDLRGSGNVVQLNKLIRPGSFGLYVGDGAIGNVLMRNTVSQGQLDGMRIDMGGTVLIGNRVKSPTRHGIILAGLGLHVVERNSVSGAGNDALIVLPGATNSMLLTNKFSKNGRGLVVQGDDTLVTNTRSLGNEVYDFSDSASGTTLISNKFVLIAP